MKLDHRPKITVQNVKDLQSFVKANCTEGIMILRKCSRGYKTIMCFEVFDKLDEMEDFLPKFDMPIYTECDDVVNL